LREVLHLGTKRESQPNSIVKKEQSMRRILKLGAFCAILSALAVAETWTGRLIDANCADSQKACDPTSTTTAFAMAVTGKVYKLDDAGNAKAVEALRNRADRSKDPTAPTTNQVAARVSGTLDGDILKVEAIQVQ
jgi:hypothetical protein